MYTNFRLSDSTAGKHENSEFIEIYENAWNIWGGALVVTLHRGNKFLHLMIRSKVEEDEFEEWKIFKFDGTPQCELYK